MEEKTKVTQKIFDDIMKVRDQSEVNMFNRHEVERLVVKNGDHATALWIHENELGYANVIFGDIVIEDTIIDVAATKKRIRELVNIIYSDYNCVGGALHIVLDDGNIEDRNITWCLQNSISNITDEKEKGIYTECAELLLKLPGSKRSNAING